MYLSNVSRRSKSRSIHYYLTVRRRSSFSSFSAPPLATGRTSNSSLTTTTSANRIFVVLPRQLLPSASTKYVSNLRCMSHVTIQPPTSTDGTTSSVQTQGDPNHEDNDNHHHQRQSPPPPPSTRLEIRQKWLQQLDDEWNLLRSNPPVPHANDDATTLLDASQEWFHVLQLGISQKRNVTTELDHMATVVTAYATQAVVTTAPGAAVAVAARTEPFVWWLQAACHAEDTPRASQALQQWQEFEQQQQRHFLQQQQQTPLSDNTTHSNRTMPLSSVNLLRHYASLASSSSPTTTTSGSSSTNQASRYQYTPFDAATITWNLYLAIQRQQTHALALDSRWNISIESYYHIVSSLSQALVRQLSSQHPQRRQQQSPPSIQSLYINYNHNPMDKLQQQALPSPRPRTAPTPNVTWDRLTRVMNELSHQSSLDHITTPQQMTWLVQTFDQALRVAELRQDHDMVLEWSEQLQRRLFDSASSSKAEIQEEPLHHQENVDMVEATPATTPSPVRQQQQVDQSLQQEEEGQLQALHPSSLGEADPVSTATTSSDEPTSVAVLEDAATNTPAEPALSQPPPPVQTIVHPILLQALQLEHVQQQLQQQMLQQQQQQQMQLQQKSLSPRQQGLRNYRGKNDVLFSSSSSSSSSLSSQSQPSQQDSLVQILARVSATMQRAILADHSFVPEMDRAKLAALIVQQLESIHDQVALLTPMESLPTTAITTKTDTLNGEHDMPTAHLPMDRETATPVTGTSETSPSDTSANVHEPTAATINDVPLETTASNDPEAPVAHSMAASEKTNPALQEKINLPLPTLENYLLAWNSWLPLVFPEGMKGPVDKDALAYFDDMFQRITTREIVSNQDLEAQMQLYTPLIRAHCGLSDTKRAEQLLKLISFKLRGLDVLYQPEVVGYRSIVKDLWNRLLHAEFVKGNYRDVVRLSSVMGSFDMYLTEIGRTLQLQSLAEISHRQEAAAARAVHHLETMLKAFHDWADRGTGSYSPPPTAQHFLSVLTAILKNREVRPGRLVSHGQIALQLLDTAEEEAAKQVHKRLQHPDKQLKYNVDRLLTIPEHYETVIAIWERCRGIHPEAERTIETLKQRLEKRQAGAVKTDKKWRSSRGPLTKYDLANTPDRVVHHNVPQVDVLLQRTRQWSGGQNILQLITLLEDWLSVVTSEDASQPPDRRGLNANNNDGTKSNSPVIATSRKRTTSQSQAVECMQLLLTEWVEVLGKATKSNLWDSSYPSDRSNKPFRLLLQAYCHLGDGPAAFEVLNEWQRALASQWSLSPDLNSLHLVLEAYIRQQHKSPTSSKTDAVAEEVAKVWELLQRWHVSGRVNLQIETISHVVKCLTFPSTNSDPTVTEASRAHSSSTKLEDPAYKVLLERLSTCFEVINNLLRSEILRPVDLYFLVRAFNDALRCAESVGDMENALKWGNVFHSTMISQPKELIDATFHIEDMHSISFEDLLDSAYGVVQRAIFSSPSIEAKDKAVFLENIIEELDTMGRSVGGLNSSQNYLRNVKALEIYALSAEPCSGKEELRQVGEQAERVLKRMKTLDTANDRNFIAAVGATSRIWCLAGIPERGEDILTRIFAENQSVFIDDSNWNELVEAWNGVFQSYCAAGKSKEAFRLHKMMANENWPLTDNSWYSLIHSLSISDHGLSFKELSTFWLQMERQFHAFQTNRKGLPPTAEAFEHGMTAFARASYPLAGEFVEGILARMTRNREKYLKPSEEHYAAAICAWLNSEHPTAESRVGFLISKMSKLGTDPSVLGYTRALKLLSRGRHPSAARQAESMLDHIEKLSLLNHDLAPTLDCYTAVIDAWLNSNSPDAVSHAQTILDRLESEYQRTHDEALKPSAGLYERMIHKWTHSAINEGGIRAEQNLSRWEKMVEEQGLERTLAPYAKVIQANQYGKQIDSGERAEAVLGRLQKYFEESNPQAVATATTGAMVAWASSSHPDMGVRAWNLFKRASKTSKVSREKNFSAAFCLETVIKACAFAPCGDKPTRDETLKAALLAFEEMQERNISVSSTVFKNLLQTFGRHVRDHTERKKIMKTIFNRCCSEGKVDAAVLANVRLHSRTLYLELCIGSNEQVAIRSEWCRNVPESNEIHKMIQQES